MEIFEVPVESCSGLDKSLVECKAVVSVGNVECCLVLGLVSLHLSRVQICHAWDITGSGSGGME